MSPGQAVELPPAVAEAKLYGEALLAALSAMSAAVEQFGRVAPTLVDSTVSVQSLESLRALYVAVEKELRKIGKEPRRAVEAAQTLCLLRAGELLPP